MGIQESGEMYLETIYLLSQSGQPVRAIDISEHMGYSKPSVSHAMSRLREGAYITVEPNGCIRLTESGRQIAETIYERHTVLTRLLTALGVRSDVAAEDACRIEHVISPESFSAIKRFGEQNPLFLKSEAVNTSREGQ